MFSSWFCLTYNQVLFGRQGAPRRRRLGFIRQAQVVVDGMGECFKHGQVVRNGIGWCCYVQVLLDVTKTEEREELRDSVE
jgi:hypothetical protein